jgi:hypothetical protein
VIEWEEDSPASVEMVSVPEPLDVAALSETKKCLFPFAQIERDSRSPKARD